MRVLVPRAAEGRDELLDGLRALGVALDAPVAYRTVAVSADRLRAAAPADLGVAAIALCSPSAAVALVAAWPASTLNRAAIVCLGETTAAAARAAGLHVRAVAARTSMADLVAAIQAVVAVPALADTIAAAAAEVQA